jgi:hypothetical protein
MKDSDMYWSVPKLYRVGQDVTANFFIPDIAIDDIMEDGVKIYEPSYIEIYVNILATNAWSVGDYKRTLNLLDSNDYPEYAQPPVRSYTPPRVGEGATGAVNVQVTPPRYVSPFGRSLPIIMWGNA